MPFRFLKYVQPTRYFLKPRIDGTYIYPNVSLLPQEVLEKLTPNNQFTSKEAQDYDMSWQAMHAGYIGAASCYTHFQNLPIQDEYAFLRLYFHPIWSLYVLFLRLIGFKNPLQEISGFLKAIKVKRKNPRENIVSSAMPIGFESSLVTLEQKVSVIIPTLNRYVYLKDVLSDLEKQTHSNFEVIVVDQSDDFSEAFYQPFKLDITLIRQEEKALWLARNTAIHSASSAYLLFFDDDSRIENDWIEQHLRCLDFYDADASCGVSLSTIGAKVPAHYAYFRIADQLDTGNVLIKKEVFRKIGLFDRQFEKQRMGDGEFGMRMYLSNYKNISNPLASRIHLKVSTGGLRQMGSWDAFRTKKLFAPRPIPSVLYFFRKYFGTKQAWFALLKSIPPSIIPYRFKKNRVLLLLGIFVSVFLLPLICIQVYISWKKASQKINEGPLISELD